MRLTRFAVLATALSLAATPLHAQVLESSSWGRKGRDARGVPSGGVMPNFIAGRTRDVEYRNFFTFDLTTFSGTITSATLGLFSVAPFLDYLGRSTSGYRSPDATETYQLTSFSTLAFSTLGMGTVFGAVDVSAADNGQLVSLNFNAAGLAALNAAVGSTLTVSGRVTTLSERCCESSDDQFVFGASGYGPAPTLTLGTTTVPEPSTVALLAAGLAGLGIAARRRRRVLVA